MTQKLKILILAAAAAAQFIGGAVAAEPREGHGHHHHHQFPKDVDAFHGVLAPVWHAAPGRKRAQNACAKVGEMERLARDIRSTDASALVAGIATLKKQCQGGKGDVEGALFEVHEAFHGLIEPKKGA